MSGYTQTILLDANRLSSEEYLSAPVDSVDPAVFTNKVSNGVTVDIGDKVSIQSAYISQRGAGGNTIEFRGSTLKSYSNVSFTTTTNSSFVGYDPAVIIRGQQQIGPTGYAYETSVEEGDTVEIFDNKASIVIEYYKNNNGENYVNLPRNWVNCSMQNAKSVTPVSGSLQFYYGSGLSVGAKKTNASYWEAPDGYVLGMNTAFRSGSHISLIDNFARKVTDYEGGYYVEAADLKNNNERFTIFKSTRIAWDDTKISSGSAAEYLNGSGISGSYNDPACMGYIIVRERKDLEIQAGYNSPSNVASEITDQLTETDTPINWGATQIDPDPAERLPGTSLIVNGAFYKAFPAPTIRTMAQTNCSHYFNASINASGLFPVSPVRNPPLNDIESLKYLNSYAFVGFKRPKIVEKGRQVFAYHGNKTTLAMPNSARTEATIRTNISWNDSVLLRIKEFFDTQKTFYPDLLAEGARTGLNPLTNYATYNTTSASLNASFIDEARYLHMDSWDGSEDKVDAEPLGDDQYLITTTDKPGEINGGVDKSSFPLFIYFNTNTSQLTTADTTGDNDDNLAYGFARRYTNDGGTTYLTELTTTRIGGVHLQYYAPASSEIATGTKIGYDYHFNAFGNAAILPGNWLNELNYFGHQEIPSPHPPFQYLGANNPLFNFNTVESRFEFSRLHTSEKIGNFMSAGEPGAADTILAPPAAPQGSSDCYKINKILQYTNWTPSMMPYSTIQLTAGAVAGQDNLKSFIEVNQNLFLNHPYDAHTGVNISNFGVTESAWERSLWGILGFSYRQFHPPLVDVLNVNTNRFPDGVTNNISGTTTNQNITAGQAVEYPMNVWSVPLYTTNPMNEIVYHSASTNLSNVTGSSTVADAGITVNMPRTIISDSTIVQAQNLPRKILKGYFLIASDIIDKTAYYQLANPFPVMATVGKYQGADDFVVMDGSGPVFTATRKNTITNIVTQILDPEGSLAQVGDNSGVIYRIDKQINTDLHFADNLMSGEYGKQSGSSQKEQ